MTAMTQLEPSLELTQRVQTLASGEIAGSSPQPMEGESSSVPRQPNATAELISPLARMIDLSSIIIPLFVFALAMKLSWGHGLGWMQLGVMIGMYWFTGFGVTVGFHRLFTHKAFQTPKVVWYALAILGSMSVQGPLLWWVAVHRRHHQHSDTEDDPHSPHAREGGISGVLRGAWHSHVGWLFRPDKPGLTAYVPDLMKDRGLVAISNTYPLWVALSLLLPALLGGILTRTWYGALMGFIWGGVLRVFLVHHITWSVNSACHLWGTQPFNSHDQSRNNWMVGIFALGEGWHNNHHAFPTSARHGLGWRQPDVTYWVIRCMSWVGLASRVKVPPAHLIAQKLANSSNSK